MNFDRLRAWLCVKYAPGLGQKGLLRLLAEYPDPEDYVSHPEHPVYQAGLLPNTAISALTTGELPFSFERIVKLCEHYEIKFSFLSDDDYPWQLKNIFSPPVILYYRGDLSVCDGKAMLGVVGTRKPSSYGIEMTRKLLSPVCESGAVIVSGLAMGIDTVSHQVAVEKGAPTIAVLAGGLESIYPGMNKALAEKIAKNGLLMTEYEPGSKMERWNFPARNRIISALVSTVFIVEGAMESGALLTGKFALEQNKDICALPGNINNINAQGPNYMIKTGAQAITAPEDLIQILGLDAKPNEQLELFPTLSKDEEEVYNFMKQSSNELNFDELMIKTGHSFGKLSVVVLNLELKGLIAKSGSGSFIVI